jgi:hypothetical protein
LPVGPFKFPPIFGALSPSSRYKWIRSKIILFAVLWIRIRNYLAVTDPDPNPAASKLTKIIKETWFPTFQKGCFTFVGMVLTYSLLYIFMFKIQLFVTIKSDQNPDSDPDPHGFGSLDPDPH